MINHCLCYFLNMSIRKIAGHDLAPGRIIKDHIHVDGTEIHVPHVIISGAADGPVLLVTAGIHNAEYVGIQAAIELSSEIDPEYLAGTLIIVPLANTSGFENRTMSMVYEDGKNLNRVFPGDENGTAADRLAHLIFNTFIRHADAFIDLHSGDGYEELFPYVYFLGDTACEEKSAAMASCVNTEFVVRSRCRTGGAYNMASVSGIPSVLIERGQLSQYPREEIDADKADVINIMKYLGMLKGVHMAYTKTPLFERELFSPATGCWYPEYHAGDTFFSGELLGTIRDYFGNTIHEIKAEETGIIIHQCASLNILKNGPMISYGVFKPDGND
jgi:predicted deacylase